MHALVAGIPYKSSRLISRVADDRAISFANWCQIRTFEPIFLILSVVSLSSLVITKNVAMPTITETTSRREREYSAKDKAMPEAGGCSNLRSNIRKMLKPTDRAAADGRKSDRSRCARPPLRDERAYPPLCSYAEKHLALDKQKPRKQ